jgi:hypothetical protein
MEGGSCEKKYKVPGNFESWRQFGKTEKGKKCRNGT